MSDDCLGFSPSFHFVFALISTVKVRFLVVVFLSLCVGILSDAGSRHGKIQNLYANTFKRKLL